MTWADLTFWHGLAFGFYAGAFIGVAVMCLMRMASDGDGSTRQ